MNTYRLGDEIIDDDNESVAPKDIEPDTEGVNTRNYQLDGHFGRIYYFITNVINIFFDQSIQYLKFM